MASEFIYPKPFFHAVSQHLPTLKIESPYNPAIFALFSTTAMPIAEEWQCTILNSQRINLFRSTFEYCLDFAGHSFEIRLLSLGTCWVLLGHSPGWNPPGWNPRNALEITNRYPLRVGESQTLLQRRYGVIRKKSEIKQGAFCKKSEIR